MCMCGCGRDVCACVGVMCMHVVCVYVMCVHVCMYIHRGMCTVSTYKYGFTFTPPTCIRNRALGLGFDTDTCVGSLCC